MSRRDSSSASNPRRRVKLATRLRGFSSEDTPLPSPMQGSSSSRWATIDADAEHATVTIFDFLSPSHPFPQMFTSDVVFPGNSTNFDVFDEVCRPQLETTAVEEAVAGDAMCFLAYGQTGSGKTHTIFGEGREPGLIQQTIRYLLSETHSSHQIDLSFIELYEDRLYDLQANGVHRRVRRHPALGSNPFVEGLSCVTLRRQEDWERLCAPALALRRSGKSVVNSRSSRSHAIVTLRWNGLSIGFVDLAGSERQENSHAPVLNKESISINKSLASLSGVIQRLSQGKTPTFRDCLLTTLLQRYLSGSSATTFLCCLHPGPHMVAETLSSLRYAQRLTSVRTKGAPLAPPTGLMAETSPSSLNGRSVSFLSQSPSSAIDASILEEVRRQAMRVQEAQRRRIDELESEVITLRAGTSMVNTSTASIASTMRSDTVVLPLSTVGDTSRDGINVNNYASDGDDRQDDVNRSLGSAGSETSARRRGRHPQPQQHLPTSALKGSHSARAVVHTPTSSSGGPSRTSSPKKARSVPDLPILQQESAEADRSGTNRSPSNSVAPLIPSTDPLQSSGSAKHSTPLRSISRRSDSAAADGADVNASIVVEQLRNAMLLNAWFSRKSAAACKTPQLQLPSLPGVEIRCDDYFESICGSKREVLGYMVVTADQAAPPKKVPPPQLSTYFAVLSISDEALLRQFGTKTAGGIDEDDEPGDVTVLVLNLLRWGLPPLFPLHPSEPFSCLRGQMAMSTLSSGTSPFRNGEGGQAGSNNSPFKADGYSEASNACAQLIVAFEIDSHCVAPSKHKSWSCDCDPIAAVASPKPYAVVATVNPEYASWPLRRAFMSELLAVEDLVAPLPAEDDGDQLPPQLSNFVDPMTLELAVDRAAASVSSASRGGEGRSHSSRHGARPSSRSPHRRSRHGSPSRGDTGHVNRSPGVVPIEALVGMRFVAIPSPSASSTNRPRAAASSTSGLRQVQPRSAGQSVKTRRNITIMDDPKVEDRTEPVLAAVPIVVDTSPPLLPAAAAATGTGPGAAAAGDQPSQQATPKKRLQRRRRDDDELAKCECTVA